MTDLGTVRLLISDTSPENGGRIFDDTEIQTFLDLEAGAVKLAAAQALDAIASNEAMVSKRIRTLDLQTDGPAVAKALRDHAANLREQVVGGEFEITTDLGTPRLRTRGVGHAELTEYEYPY